MPRDSDKRTIVGECIRIYKKCVRKIVVSKSHIPFRVQDGELAAVFGIDDKDGTKLTLSKSGRNLELIP